MGRKRDSTEHVLQIRELWGRYKGRCQYCNSPTLLIVSRRFGLNAQSYDGCSYDEYGEPWPFATRDHKIPVSRGGPDVIQNMTLACSPCNHKKDSLTPEEFESVKAWGCDADRMFRQILIESHSRQSKQPKQKKDKKVKQVTQQVEKLEPKKKILVKTDSKGCVWYKHT